MRKKYSSPSGHQHLQVSSIPDPQPLHSGPTITTPRTSVLITSRHITPHHITSHHRTSSLHTTLNPPSIARHPHNNSLTPYHKPPTHPTKPPKQASHPPPPKQQFPPLHRPPHPNPSFFARTHAALPTPVMHKGQTSRPLLASLHERVPFQRREASAHKTMCHWCGLLMAE